MDRVVKSLKEQVLPDSRVYLTLDICVEYAIQNQGKFPSYRTIGRILSELLGKDKPISPSVVQYYLLELEDSRRLERTDRGWRIRGGRFIYYDTP